MAKPLQRQLATIPFARGLDTKSDPRALSPPGMADLQNAVFDEIGGYQLRPGMTPVGLDTAEGGTIDPARFRAIGTRGDELLGFAQGALYSWSEKDQAWHNKGRLEPPLVRQRTVSVNRTDQVLPDEAQTGNVIVRAWEDLLPAPGVRYQCYDAVTGVQMISNGSPFISAATRPKCFALAGKLMVFYVDATAGELRCDVIDPADVYNTIGTPVTVHATAPAAYDIDSYSATEGVLAMSDGGTAKIRLFNSAAAITATRNTARTADTAIAINYRAGTDRFALVRIDEAGAGDIYLDWLTAALADDGAFVNIAVATNQGASDILNVAVAVLTGQVAYVFWDQETDSAEPPTSPEANVFRASVTTAASTEKVLVRRSRIGSRAIRWTDGSTERVMIHVFHVSDLQSCYVLIDAGYVVGDRNGTTTRGEEVGLLAHLFPGEGPAATTTRMSTSGVGGLYRVGHLPQIQDLGSNQFAVALSYRRYSADGISNHATSDFTWDGSGRLRNYYERGIREVVYTFFDSRAFRSVQEGKAIYGPGGYVWAYDGRRPYEAGILLFTEGMTLAQSDTADGALTLEGTYNYRAFWEAINDAGEVLMSSHAGDVSITLTGTNDTVTATVPILPYTNRLDDRIAGNNKCTIRLALFRTEDGLASPAYRVTSLDPGASTFAPQNNPNSSTGSITFVDKMSDTDLIEHDTDYLSNGEVDNIAMPATNLVAAGQGRLFTVDTEDLSLIRHSKIRLLGEAVAGHDGFTIRTPQDGGDTQGLEVTEGALIPFKDNAAYVVSGQGPDNTGENPYPSPQRISEIGCDDVRSIASLPIGILRKSAKGFYLLDKSYADSYVGAPVEDYNDLAIQGALPIVDKHRVQFVATTIGQLVYDYLINEWSVWPDRQGISATMWQGEPIHLETTGPWEQQATFADNTTGYSMLVETGWFRTSDLQGSQQIFRAIVLGEYRSPFTMRVSFAYDYEPDFFTMKEWEPGSNLSAGRRIQAAFTIPLHRQKCQAIKMRIEFIPYDANTPLREGCTLTGVTFEYGVESGAPPFGRGQTR